MPIHFDASRWEAIHKTYDSWWKRELKRPLMIVKLEDAHSPEGSAPKAPFLDQGNCNDFTFSPEEIIDAIDYRLQKYEFLGDAFPCYNFDSFGPGVLSAFCGAELDNSTGRVWFSAKEYPPIEEVHVKYDPNNKWARRIKDIYRAGIAKWKGQVIMGMPDMGGILDIAAIFRKTETLMMDLIDSPDEVLRLCEEIQTAWHEAYDDLAGVLQTGNGGYSDWGGLYSATPAYILQSDFSYMIGPEMFEQFTLPFLKKDCQKLDHSIYHLDGVGQIPHLEKLLAIDELDAVQWVYGEGKPTARHWIDLYQKIEKSGKGIYVLGDTDDFKEVYKQVKNYLYFNITLPAKEAKAAEELLAHNSP